MRKLAAGEVREYLLSKKVFHCLKKVSDGKELLRTYLL